MKFRWVDIHYKGFDFRVEGEWQDNCFQEYDITLNDESIWDLLVTSAVVDIVNKAEEKLQEEDNDLYKFKGTYAQVQVRRN